MKPARAVAIALLATCPAASQADQPSGGRMKMDEPMHGEMKKDTMRKGDVKKAAERKKRKMKPVLEKESAAAAKK
jgi:hypothetical protein